MLTSEQINAFRELLLEITDPINDYLIKEIARHISEAGQLTSTASYQVWLAQTLGKSQRKIKAQLQKLLNVSKVELEKLLTQSAEVGYDFDIKHLPHTQAVPFDENESLKKILAATISITGNDLDNLTRTMGMVAPNGKALPLQDVYRKCCDFAFKQVFTGASDYNTAIRKATENLAKYGVQTIDYKSGVHTSLEAAVRRSVMGGMGLMQEQISLQNHDDLGANGWEISAHSASAPDHEPIQGKQYSDKEYKALNSRLRRRIGTLNCGHMAFPIILGVSKPQYTKSDLNELREKNENGITFEGRHYTTYEATQMQRRIERAIRMQKRRVLASEATGDTDKLKIDQSRLKLLRQRYRQFSKGTGLRTQNERTHVSGFGRR